MIVKKHVFPLSTWSKRRPRQEPELYPGKSGTFRAPIPTKIQQLGSVSSPCRRTQCMSQTGECTSNLPWRSSLRTQSSGEPLQHQSLLQAGTSLTGRKGGVKRCLIQQTHTAPGGVGHAVQKMQESSCVYSSTKI